MLSHISIINAYEFDTSSEETIFDHAIHILARMHHLQINPSVQSQRHMKLYICLTPLQIIHLLNYQMMNTQDLQVSVSDKLHFQFVSNQHLVFI